MKESEKRALLQRAGIAKIALEPFAVGGDMPDAIEHIAEVLSETIDVARTGIWQLSDTRTELKSLTVYERGKGKHTRGEILKTGVFPSYFRAMMTETRIYAEDAQNDLRTAELADSYLKPLGISSLLDSGIISEGRLIGVVCCEHTGPVRNWHPDEEAFVSTVASMVAQLFVNHERRLAEKTLEESEKKYRSLTNQLPVGVYRTTTDGQLVFANPALVRMLGYGSVEELLQLNVSQLYVNPSEREKQFKAKEYNDKVVQSEFRLWRKSGEQIWVKDNSRLLLDSNGKPEYFDGVLEDITGQKASEKALLEAKEKAEESDRLKSMFLANISHEVRTPMNAITGFLELLKSSGMTIDELKKHVNIIDQGAQRLMSTINDIVEISRIESGHVEIVLSEVSVSDMMSYHYDFFRQDSVSKGIEFRLTDKSVDEVSTIITDRHKLDSILTNLLINALKFTPEGGYVEFGNYREDDLLVLYVRDTGIGIPVDQQDIIFERFVQVKMDGGRSYEGSGLGLAISRAYAGMIDGEIRVESSEGTGSTFYLRVPLVLEKKTGEYIDTA
ncbi:MAG: PAS domain S-box protein [Marinilabiliales bacterium]|nr:MAG: PAS domain S-box protein [Marinilabiliales bacterium]